ncbi:glycoside hydrolase family 28 protein [Lentithecium fluviatile CBS 122367]|uniref:Glycoside hydrolase family 28 protein n=1 Tax=Lentithecium fluviatile CBS 122367 TaxID=1168545 RepID=A0A6G1IFD7_9PLEO|nr:glycoside hydrolase family 28 protein [Lentithecium fluviatile CBS 122367]
MKSAILLSVATAAFASPRYHKRAICTVASLDDPLADDVPAIADALQKCGDTGRVVLPANRTFRIRSPIDLSPCQRCDFQIDGLLSISPDWDYWSKQPAVIKISKTKNAVIHSDGNTGAIDANNFGWAGDSNLLDQVPKLVSISDASYQIHVRSLELKNVPGTAFHVNSDSSAVRFYSVNFQTPAVTGYLVEHAQHVYVWNNTIRSSGSCVSILPNSTNVQVEESTCITTGAASTQSGFELKFGAGTGLDWIRNVFVKNIVAIGSMDVVSLRAGTGGDWPHPVEINNVTFTGITLEGPARKAVNLEEGQNKLIATDVMLQGFVGAAQHESDLRCTHPADLCELEAEDWNVVIRN